MANPYLVVRSFNPANDGTGALMVDITAYDGGGVEVPGIHRTLVVPADVLQQIVAQLPAQPEMQDAYNMILTIAGTLDPQLSVEALTQRIAANDAAQQASAALAGILAQFGLPASEVQVPIPDVVVPDTGVVGG